MTGLLAQLPAGQEALKPQPLPHPLLPDPTPLEFGTPWWWYALGGMVILYLLVLVLWLLFRSKRPSPPPLPRPWKRARESLGALQKKAASQPPVEVAHEVSEILRRYFMERYQIPAPFRTTRELFRHGGAQNSQSVQRYEPLACLWDELSFAPAPVTAAAASALIERAVQHLEEDRP